MTKIEELKGAKNNVALLLDNMDLLIDMHGLVYWAGVVERLREEIKKSL